MLWLLSCLCFLSCRLVFGLLLPLWLLSVLLPFSFFIALFLAMMSSRKEVFKKVEELVQNAGDPSDPDCFCDNYCWVLIWGLAHEIQVRMEQIPTKSKSRRNFISVCYSQVGLFCIIFRSRRANAKDVMLALKRSFIISGPTRPFVFFQNTDRAMSVVSWTGQSWWYYFSDCFPWYYAERNLIETARIFCLVWTVLVFTFAFSRHSNSVPRSRNTSFNRDNTLQDTK